MHWRSHKSGSTNPTSRPDTLYDHQPINIDGIMTHLWTLLRWLPTPQLTNLAGIIHIQERKCLPANIAAIRYYSKSIGYHLYHIAAFAVTSSTSHTAQSGTRRKRAQHDAFYGGVITLVKHGRPTAPYLTHSQRTMQFLCLQIHGITDYMNFYRNPEDTDEHTDTHKMRQPTHSSLWDLASTTASHANT